MIPCINDIFWILCKIAQCAYSLLTWSYHWCINLHLDKCVSLFWCNESEYQNKNCFTKYSYPDQHKHCKMFFEMHFVGIYIKIKMSRHISRGNGKPDIFKTIASKCSEPFWGVFVKFCFKWKWRPTVLVGIFSSQIFKNSSSLVAWMIHELMAFLGPRFHFWSYL